MHVDKDTKKVSPSRELSIAFNAKRKGGMKAFNKSLEMTSRFNRAVDSFQSAWERRKKKPQGPVDNKGKK